MRQGKPIATTAGTCPGRVPRCDGLAVRPARRGTLRGAGEPAGHDATVHRYVLAVPPTHERKKYDRDRHTPNTEPQLRALTPELSRAAKRRRLGRIV
ncbi:hypothetical protein, partial [Lysobacter sp. N42]|uniref:hypothetical protein n=1 Tax=Lysobacter sp. N42 TaxID=2545719 RepID=UPI001A9FC0CF